MKMVFELGLFFGPVREVRLIKAIFLKTESSQLP